MSSTRRLLIVFLTMCMLCMMPVTYVGSVVCYAEEFDDFDSGEEVTDDYEGSSDVLGANQPISEDDNNVADWLSNQRAVTGEQLQKSTRMLSPISNAIGTVVGIIIALTLLGVGLITALDLLYMAFPPIRNLLYKAGTDGTGAYTGGGPYGGGYGNRAMGGFMGGVGGASNGGSKPTQWVSDEAVQCAAMMGGSAQVNQGVMGYGGAQQQQPGNMKSVIGVYFRKRMWFLILLCFCVVILTSSVIMGTGVNLAKWGLKILTALNGFIPA